MDFLIFLKGLLSIHKLIKLIIHGLFELTKESRIMLKNCDPLRVYAKVAKVQNSDDIVSLKLVLLKNYINLNIKRNKEKENGQNYILSIHTMTRNCTFYYSFWLAF